MVFLLSIFGSVSCPYSLTLTRFLPLLTIISLLANWSLPLRGLIAYLPINWILYYAYYILFLLLIPESPCSCIIISYSFTCHLLLRLVPDCSYLLIVQPLTYNPLLILSFVRIFISPISSAIICHHLSFLYLLADGLTKMAYIISDLLRLLLFLFESNYFLGLVICH